GTMGSTAEQVANLDRSEVYLPRLNSDILTPIGGDQPITISLDADASLGLSEQQASHATLTVQPGSLLDFEGNPIADGEVGFSMVDPELVRDMLPEGLKQLSATLTIQAPGVAAFSTPIELTYPNIYDAEPGTKLFIYSFDHTTGRLEI